MTGDAAEQAREAESRQRAGDLGAAILMLEEALEASLATQPEMPGWLCGRLAALYRTSGRYDDEVRLLERYRESQNAEEARTRYDARLSKARTIAERKRRSESGALASVRASLCRPRPRRGQRSRSIETAPPITRFSESVLDELRDALGDATDSDERRLRAVLVRLSNEAHAANAPAERLVEAMKEARDTPDAEPSVMSARASRYGSGLLVLLALHFEERTP
ncbi:MAG: hypothetical protein ACJ8AD_01165 [Gemmatimonadaceae bacterium]